MSTIIAIALCAAVPIGIDDPPKPSSPPAAVPAAEFRLAIKHFDVGKEPDSIGEILASRGRVYHLVKDSDEVIVIDPARKVVHFLDLKLGLAADLTYREADAQIAATRDEQRKSIAGLAKSQARADRVDAEMRRDLIDPRFRVDYDEASHTLRLANTSVQFEARGEPEADAARLAILAESLVTLSKLRAYREPENLRYLVEIDTVSALVVGRKLRPVESTYFFRLAGPLEKYRWTFLLVPEVVDKERQGLDLIEGRLLKARHVPFARYDRRVDPDEIK